jgi:hypothetical protein
MIFCHVRTLALMTLFAGVAALSSCADKEAATVAVARTALLGLSEVDIRMCAGFPSRTVDIESGQIWTYERSINRGGLSVALPTVGVGAFPELGGSVNVAPGGYCNAQVRFANGRVVDIAYAGDNDLPRGRNALCTTVVDECVAYARTPHPAVKER